MSTTPLYHVAGEREAGCTCPRCGSAVGQREPIAVCPQCGSVHHTVCWDRHGGCGAYSCAPARVEVPANGAGVLRVSLAELEQAVPLPTRRPVSFAPTSWTPPAPEPPRTSRLAVAAFIVAVLGIPMFGLLTGLVAVVLGCIALGALRDGRQRGLGWALAGTLLGLADVVGWIILLGVVLGRGGPVLTVQEFGNDMAALDQLGPELNRAMRANVLLEVSRGWFGGRGSGSGVVLDLKDGEALLVTNRHVVDPGYSGSADEGGGVEKLGPVRVRFVSGAAAEGRVVWRAPHGIDLALVRVRGDTSAVKAALWRDGRPTKIGDPVFAIGNPMHLGWTHTQGTISQVRRQAVNGRDVRVLQTQTAINPGNSGGGLYDKEGYLIGINTWTQDKRFSEGLNFAIALEALLELEPPGLAARPEER